MIQHLQGLKHWTPATDIRRPWAPDCVLAEIQGWLTENEYADALKAAGEKVLPLLLVGETRCGKTSTLIHCARNYFDIPAYRMATGSVMGSHLGEMTRAIVVALQETVDTTSALWILDEADGLFAQRSSGSGDAAGREMNAAMTQALTVIENLPSHVTLAATTNEIDLMDRAMVARFRVVEFPKWGQLEMDERRAFAKSHGCEDAWQSRSYSEAVQKARSFRVQKIIAEARSKVGAQP